MTQIFSVDLNGAVEARESRAHLAPLLHATHETPLASTPCRAGVAGGEGTPDTLAVLGTLVAALERARDSSAQDLLSCRVTGSYDRMVSSCPSATEPGGCR